MISFSLIHFEISDKLLSYVGQDLQSLDEFLLFALVGDDNPI